MLDIIKAKEVAADVQLSAQSKATFEKNARRDEETGELFMGEEEFVDAVAPKGEDYVSACFLLASLLFFILSGMDE
jgi:hypothetical protein